MKLTNGELTTDEDGTITATGDGIRIFQFTATRIALRAYVERGYWVTPHPPKVRNLNKQWNLQPPCRTYEQVLYRLEGREAMFRTHQPPDVRWLTHGEASPKS